MSSAVAYPNFSTSNKPQASTGLTGQGYAGPSTTTTVLDELKSQGWQYRTYSNTKNRHKGTCPFGAHEHDDTNPQFSIAADGDTFICRKGHGGGIGLKAFHNLLGIDEPRIFRPAPTLGKPSKPKEKLQGATLAQLAEAKGLDANYLEYLGWHDTKHLGVSAVAMPYHDQQDNKAVIKYRVGINEGTTTLWPKGTKILPLGLHQLALARQAGYIVLVEGETDFATLDYHGIPCLGLPGVTSWKPEWLVYLNGIKTIYVWEESGGTPNKDGLTPGQQMVKRIADSVGQVRVIRPPAGSKDPCELAHLCGDKFPSQMQELIDGAVMQCATVEVLLTATCNSAGSATDSKPELPASLATEIQLSEIPSIPLLGILGISDKTSKPRKSKGKKSALWDWTVQQFRMPRIAPLRVGAVLYNQAQMKLVFCDLYADTWRHPSNAMFKRRLLFFNLLPRLRAAESLFRLDVPIDDWTKTKKNTLQRQISRMEGEHIWVLSRGCVTILTDVEIPGSTCQVDAPDDMFADLLRGISPPKSDKAERDRRKAEQDRSQFRPYGGSHAWASGAMRSVDESQEKNELIAKLEYDPERKTAGTNWVPLEADLVVGGVKYDFIEPYYRAQIGQSIEARGFTVREKALDWVLELPGYYPLLKKGTGAEIIEEGVLV